MKDLAEKKTFAIGFGFGIFVMAILNLLTLFQPQTAQSDGKYYGFPVSFYYNQIAKCGEGYNMFPCELWYFSWSGAIVDIFAGILFSFLIGFCYKFVSSKMA